MPLFNLLLQFFNRKMSHFFENIGHQFAWKKLGFQICSNKLTLKLAIFDAIIVSNNTNHKYILWSTIMDYMYIYNNNILI